MRNVAPPSVNERFVYVPTGEVPLEGSLALPSDVKGMVLFAHGSGSSRHSPRNQYVAKVLQEAGLATLLVDLLTSEEEKVDDVTAELRFDIPLLARRLVGIVDWLGRTSETRDFPVGLFGASTGAAAALIAAAELPDKVKAVVSRGGRPDLANGCLDRVYAPTLLIVGSKDHPVIHMNCDAMDRLTVEKRMIIVPGASHLFDEPGTLGQAARYARQWFEDHLGQGRNKRVA